MSNLSLVKAVTPRDFNLPYDDWWPGQLAAIRDTYAALDDPDNDVVMLIADTGTGKTGIATAISQMFRISTVLAPTISLEEQYQELTGLEVGRGRRWHKCLHGSDALKCWQREECSGPCPYRIHIEKLKSQKMRVLNYAQFYALNQGRKDGGFRSDLVICDEGHGLEKSLQSFAELWYGEDTPTWGSEYRHLLFGYTKKVLIMSATMIPELVAETVGIPRYKLIEATNDFDADRNPVFVKPVGYITSNRPHFDRITRWIDNHLDSTTFNGVVHTSSDKQTEEILSLTRHRGRFIWPKGRTRAEQFRQFKDAKNQGAVLISASSYEGQDFPGDECRWQIICKVPYADLGSPHVRARREERPDIYRLEALQRIQQACGRGMRGPDDWCSNYILDATVVNLYEKYGGLLSQRFRDSWKGVV